MPLKKLKRPVPVVAPEPFERLPSTVNQPAYKPLHPGFTGKFKITKAADHQAKKLDGEFYSVDLGAGTCTCRNGQAFTWHIKNEDWTRSQTCSHKIRAMSDILDKAGRPSDMQAVYAKEVGSRYNMYEVVSAFHKELRIGHVERAVFWGTMLANFRGSKGVIKYMLNILYEETRDHTMGNWLLDTLIAGDKANEYANMCRGIAIFCQSKKKWQMPSHFDFLMHEMRGYERLVKEFGRDVAKGGDIIADKAKPALFLALKNGLKTGKHDLTQYGLKGLQKLKTGDIDVHRAWIINTLAADENIKTGNGNDDEAFLAFIAKRAGSKYGIGYHELNAYIDFLSGEPYAAGNTPQIVLKRVLAAPPPPLRLGVAPTIPQYAHDNHTWAGKALLRRFPEQWQPGAVQTEYDLRLCGAYMGVNWRHLAFKQFGRIDCNWADVQWPKWLHETVSNLWY